MAAAVTLDQIIAAGADVQRMPGSSTSTLIDKIARRANDGLARLFQHWLVARGEHLLRGDPEGVARLVGRMRRLHEHLDRPSAALASLIDAEAVRRPGPGLDLPAPPTPAEWFAPRKGSPDGFVFYVHGGSFVAERSPRITALVARLAAAAGASVYAPSYRLAPESPCPAAVDDITAAYRWFKIAKPDEPVVAVAESAGAAILLAALQRARDEGLKPPDGLLLLSPWVDLSLQSWSVVAASIAGTTPYTMQSLALIAQLYLNGRMATDPLASPLFGDFTDFPPTLIHASTADILYDDAVRLADRIRQHNGDLTLRLWSDETHVWERLENEPAKRSIELAANFIRRQLG